MHSNNAIPGVVVQCREKMYMSIVTVSQLHLGMYKILYVFALPHGETTRKRQVDERRPALG